MAEEEKYLKCVYKLHDKCQQIQRENERYVARLHYIKKLTKRQQKDVNLLKNRLDLYNDNWRTAQPNNIKSRRIVQKTTKLNRQAAGNPGNGNAAAPITKRKRSSQSSYTKRQSVNSRTRNPESNSMKIDSIPVQRFTSSTPNWERSMDPGRTSVDISYQM